MNTEISLSPAARLRLAAATEDHRWRETAACRGMDTELFFPAGTRPEAAEPALRVCAGCRVRRECLAEALVVEDPVRRFGVVGATTPVERYRLYRAARRAAAPASQVSGWAA
ncbi:WhiB family transcriptional regulator [Pseudonocardia sp. ICBG1293]|uniref:WhiB family transcriptional regulator n=1 Tax=Pseudonocardia sp. ICBG1293 TaxID=2844382 RepID=UPI001CCD0EB2|nr:WhiB family transcriptional regulator [Pseudonocardia sp. ICBG1293]